MQQRIKNFLFKNTGIKQTIFKNAFWLTCTEAVTRFLGLFLVMYVIRILGAVQYGKFYFAVSFASLASIFASLGILDIATREFSKHKDQEKNLNSIFTLQIVLCLATLAITVCASFFMTGDPSTRAMVWILSIFILSSNVFGILFSFLRARQKMEYEAFARIFQTVINTAAVFFVIFFAPSALSLSLAYMVSNLVVVVLVLVFFHVSFEHLTWKWEKNTWHILKMSWPLSLGFTSEWLLILINPVLLGLFSLNAQNGWYGASSKIAVAAIVPADLVLKSFYPALSGFFANSKETFQKAWYQFMELMIFLAVPTVVGGFVMAPRVIGFFYGPDFMPSILIFQMLVVVIAIAFLSYPYAIALVIADQQKKNFILILMGAFLNIILDVILIPMYGVYGATFATIVASLVIFIAMAMLCQKKIPLLVFNMRLVKSFLAALFSSAVMYFVLTYPVVYYLNVFLACFIGALVYGLVLFFMYTYFLHKPWKSL